VNVELHAPAVLLPVEKSGTNFTGEWVGDEAGEWVGDEAGLDG